MTNPRSKTSWICIETLEATIQTGPFPTRRAARKHRRHCTGPCAKSPRTHVVTQPKPPITGTSFDPATHILSR